MSRLEGFRFRLARANALLPLSVIGVVSGTATGLVILAFRWLIESTQGLVLPGDDLEAYESLGWAWQALLPLIGGILVGLLFHYGGNPSSVGVIHVMERLARHEGYLPLRNAVIQFFGAALSIASGHSVGREGPGIHLGAAASSLLGQRLRLPNNAIRILVACGTAASIAAFFNTPIAGVIFAMEVVMMEYSIAGFTPVILASVSATTLCRAVYGPEPAFSIPALDLTTLWELPYVVCLGVAVGAVGAAFTALVRQVDARTHRLPFGLRVTVAGLLTGLIAVAVPEIMGIGYDTVELALLSKLGLGALCVITAAKLLATALGIGLGLPGGLIGPTLVIGATAGGAMGVLAHTVTPLEGTNAGLYALLGMGAMTGAVLQAPLAALMAILELTANPNTILPGMLAIVAATLTAAAGFGQRSVFVTLLRRRGVDYRPDPLAVVLNRTGVAAVMETHFAATARYVSQEVAMAVLEPAPQWVVLTEEDGSRTVLPTSDLARLILEASRERSGGPIDLGRIGEHCRAAVPVPIQATLREALETLDEHHADAACITRKAVATDEQMVGVLTREKIRAMVWGPR